MGNWQINLDVTNVKPFIPGKFLRPPDGDYLMLCGLTDLKPLNDAAKAAAGENNVVFHMRMPADSEFAGLEQMIFLQAKYSVKPPPGMPEGKDKKAWELGNRRWRTAAESTGIKPEQLDAQPGGINQSLFEGKVMSVHIQNPVEGDLDRDGKPAKYADYEFISRRDYDKNKAREAAKPKTTPVGAAPAAAQPAQLGSLAQFLQPAAAGAVQPATVAPAAAVAPTTVQPANGAATMPLLNMG
ncbi:MAG: hypothetical protein A2W26_03215 [Acidobacteria bacterium RBG_16_64_8]|nr:MAG: hypothetical protein A2W26_03215 [Acidobacteria bacterium RBG_16_64_8]